MGLMNPTKHTTWQLITLNRLSKAAGVVKRNTSPLDGRKPSSLEWSEWSDAMVQAMAFGLDPVLVIEVIEVTK